VSLLLGVSSLFLWQFGVIAVELFSAIFIINGLGLPIAYVFLYVGAQLLLELIVNQYVGGLASRFGAFWLIGMSIPFRLAAFAGLQFVQKDVALLFIISAIAAVGAGLSDATRSAYVARAIGSFNRGKKLGLVEAVIFMASSLGALCGAYIYSAYGFVTLILAVGAVLTCSMILLWLSEKIRTKVIAEPTDVPSYGKLKETKGAATPFWLVLAWWMTGWRYFIEGILYPLYALVTYGSVLKVGLLAAVGPVSGYLAGMLFDRGYSLRSGFAFSLAAFGLVGIARSLGPDFTVAIVLACATAVLGKALGMFEKAQTFVASQDGHRLDVMVRRERHSVLARLPIIFIGFFLDQNPGQLMLAAYGGMLALALVMLSGFSLIRPKGSSEN
jgi:MFS family permease